MQGKRSAIGSLPESLGFDNMRNSASNRLSDYISSNNSGVAYLNSSRPEGQTLSGWSIGEPSSSAVQNHLSQNAQKMEHSWGSSVSAGDGTVLEDQQYAPASGLSLNNVNLSLSGNQIASGPMFLQSSGSDSDSFSQDLNGNAGYELQGADDCQIVECPLVFRSGSSENSWVQSGSSSADPFGLRSDEHMEDNDIRTTAPSLDGRRLSCKRKAIEGNIGQSSGSGSLTYFQDTEGSVWRTVPSRRSTNSSLTISNPSDSITGMSQPELVNPRLGLDVGRVASEISPVNAASTAENSPRNFRLRISSSHQQDSIPTNVFAAANAIGPSSSSHQSARNPLHNALDLRSATAAGGVSPQGLLAHVPAMRRNLQSSRWNRSSSSRPGSTPSFPTAEERNTTSHEESSSRSIPTNISEHPVFVPASMRNLPHNPVNWSLPSGSVTSSRNGSTSGVHQPSGPTWASHRNSPQYSRRLSELVGRSLISSSGPESRNRIDISPPRSSTSASTQEVAPSSGDDAHHLSHSRSAMLLDRHRRLDGALALPYSIRALASANEGRSRLVSEIRNVLDLMRRGEGLRFEDAMVLNQSIFFGMGDIHDRHRDMRLDVDNMSYEELLALEERIGNVNTGVSEETISSFLKQRKYALIKTDQENEEPCCICQEEYKDEDFLGSLECGHNFHVDCIKQWLTHKNLCPICKTTAMSTKG